MTTAHTVDDGWKLSWQPMVDAVGTDFGADVVWRGADRIDPSSLRRFLEPLELDCPLHHDEAFARRHGHDGVIAPFASLLTYTIPPMWAPGDEPLFDDPRRDAQPARSPLRNPPTGIEPDTAGYFATDIELDLLAPPVLGQHLSRSGNRLVSCTPKETSVGWGAFTSWESTISATPGADVARLRIGRYSYVPKPPRATTAVPAQPADHPSAPGGGGVDTELVDWERATGFDEIRVGDELTPVAFPLSVYRLIVAAGANRDFNSIHHNSDYARATGAADMYANTTFLLGMWERAAREHLGPSAVFTAVRGFRMGRFNTAGSTVVVRGRVVRRWTADGKGHVAVEIWSENDGAITVGPGHLEATMPLGGPTARGAER